MTESLLLDALQHAISDRQPPSELTQHTDRGGQYAGHEYWAILRRAAMRQSMSRAVNCYDNAFMEYRVCRGPCEEPSTFTHRP